MRRSPTPGKPAAPRAPRGLTVERLESGDDELLVFSWSETSEPEVELSDAERDVLARIARGDSNAEIAKARNTSVRTVANQVASLLRKTGAASRYELIGRFAGTKPRHG